MLLCVNVCAYVSTIKYDLISYFWHNTKNMWTSSICVQVQFVVSIRMFTVVFYCMLVDFQISQPDNQKVINHFNFDLIDLVIVT